MRSIATGSAQSSAKISLRRPTPPPYGPDCSWKTAISDRAPLRRPPRRAQLRCCSAGYGAVSEKEPRPTVTDRAPGEIIPDKLTVYRFDFLLRRGARAPLTPRRRCLPAPGTGHSGEKTVSVHARCRSARENWAFLRKTPLAAASLLRPTVSVRAPWRFILFRQVRNS